MAEGEQDPVSLRAAQILVSLRRRELRQPPDWPVRPPPPLMDPRVPEWWPTRPRSRPSRPRAGMKEAPCLAAAAVGSGQAERDAAAALSPEGPGPSSAGAAPSGAQPQHAALAKTDVSSPVTPLEGYVSGASSSGADDEAGAAKRKVWARGSGSGADDEGSSSPSAKRARGADQEEEEQPMVFSAPVVEERPVLDFDLNLPWPQEGDPDAS